MTSLNETSDEHDAAEETPAPKKYRADLSRPVGDRLQARQRALSFAKGRWVTLTEVVEDLLDQADITDQLVADALDGK
jgi:hypothetical protein